MNIAKIAAVMLFVTASATASLAQSAGDKSTGSGGTNGQESSSTNQSGGNSGK